MLNRIFRLLYHIEQKLLGRFGLGRLPLAKKLKAKIFPKVLPSVAEVWGLKFHLDPVYGFMDPENYKKAVADLLRREVKKGDVVIDVGANIGLFTCLMAKLVGPGGKVYAFEPEPQNLKLLRKNIAENNFENIIVVLQKALSDGPGKLKIASEGAHASFGSVVDDSGAAEVDLACLDNLDEVKNKRVSLIKMDITGYEAKALRGMRETISRNPSAKIISAFCPAYLARVGDSGKKYLETLLALGFKIYKVSKAGTEEVNRANFGSFIQKYSPRGGVAQAEIFCLRMKA